jgi:hypothetical protein
MTSPEDANGASWKTGLLLERDHADDRLSDAERIGPG